ncbi:MAG: GTP 3',8-cyclase MoaA [Synergistaceae bacterium]|jgi:cyclic pyranopterin phosphate synthase|nr:GTP 3',8-cyclase MoaA [Synergistaceae bacterium]
MQRPIERDPARANRGEIIDDIGRRINYARISVTDRCNYRCSYCMPEDGVSGLRHDEIMRYEDITFLCRVLEGLGVRKFRFTGGEPLVRKGMITFLRGFRRDFPNAALALTTNASLLGKYSADLAGIGLASLNISLDTLNPEKFRRITRVGDLRDVVAGVGAARAAGVPTIKTNTVLIRGFNDDELPAILSFAWDNGFMPRIIEFMPLDGALWREDKFISAREVLGASPFYEPWRPTAPEGTGEVPSGPAAYYIDNRNRVVGIIDAVSKHFCASCNRLRVSASGCLRACLFGAADVRLLDMLRERDEVLLREAVLTGMMTKPEHWDVSSFGAGNMSGIGG